MPARETIPEAIVENSTNKNEINPVAAPTFCGKCFKDNASTFEKTKPTEKFTTVNMMKNPKISETR